MLFFIRCKEHRVEEIYYTSFYFGSPQPVNDSELSNFPIRYRGIYSKGEDTMYIDKKAIYYSMYRLDTINKTQLDSLGESLEYRGDKLIIKFDDYVQEYTVKDKGGLLYLSSRHRDTLFALSPQHKAKRINGSIVISYKDSTFWRSNIFSLQSDSLVWKYFATPDDYATIKPYIKDIRTNIDTTVIHLKPTRKEFSKLLGLKISEKKYKKIK